MKVKVSSFFFLFSLRFIDTPPSNIKCLPLFCFGAIPLKGKTALFKVAAFEKRFRESVTVL